MNRDEKLIELSENCPNSFKHGKHCIGFEIEDGWFDIVYECLQKIEDCIKEDPEVEKVFAITQIKQKLGSLRIYYGPSLSAKQNIQSKIDDYILKARTKASQTCEFTGKPGRKRVIKTPEEVGGYIAIVSDEQFDIQLKKRQDRLQKRSED